MINVMSLFNGKGNNLHGTNIDRREGLMSTKTTVIERDLRRQGELTLTRGVGRAGQRGLISAGGLKLS